MHITISPEAAETFVERWPAALAALAGPFAYRTLSEMETSWLIAQEPSLRRTIGVMVRPPMDRSLRKALISLASQMELPLFARISPCSFKKGYLLPAPLASADALLRQLQHPGPRAASLALRCLWGGVPVSVIVRPWQAMRPWEEYRFFFRKGVLTAISQHHPAAELPRHWRKRALADTLCAFAEQLIAASHLDTLTADVFACANTDKVLLIEINPWAEETDPSLYDWHKDPPVDKALRVRQRDSVLRIPLVHVSAGRNDAHAGKSISNRRRDHLQRKRQARQHYKALNA